MSKKKAKYSVNFERDWDFYLTNLNKLTFWGGDPIFQPKHDPNGIDAKEFFHRLDSTGMKKMQDKTCREPQLVSDVLRFKKALNFHIKMWAEGFEDCGQGVHEYMSEFSNPPEWVETSFRNQLNKVRQRRAEVLNEQVARPAGSEADIQGREQQRIGDNAADVLPSDIQSDTGTGD